MGARATRARVKLAVDHHYSPAIATELRARGHDVIAVSERGWEAEDDASLLALCTQELRPLLTNNVDDFTAIVRAWAVEGRQHSGLVFTSDVSMPRGRNAIGRCLEALDGLMRPNSADDPFADRVHWL
jgi:hypothetical protein